MRDFSKAINRIGFNSKKWDACESMFGSKDIIPMWIADMDFQVPEEAVQAIAARADHGIFGYTGTPDSYLNAVVSWMERHHHWNIEKEWICHSPGVVTALSLLIDAYTLPGDKIIVQSPVYYPFARVVRTSGRTLLDNPLRRVDGRYTMDLENLKAQLDSSVKMIFLCSPHNPVGRVWSRDELMELAEICLQHNIIMVSDEVHDAGDNAGQKQVGDGALRRDAVDDKGNAGGNDDADGSGRGGQRGGVGGLIALLLHLRDRNAADGGHGGRRGAGQRGEEHGRNDRDHAGAAGDGADQRVCETKNSSRDTS